MPQLATPDLKPEHVPSANDRDFIIKRLSEILLLEEGVSWRTGPNGKNEADEVLIMSCQRVISMSNPVHHGPYHARPRPHLRDSHQRVHAGHAQNNPAPQIRRLAKAGDSKEDKALLQGNHHSTVHLVPQELLRQLYGVLVQEGRRQVRHHCQVRGLFQQRQNWELREDNKITSAKWQQKRMCIV